VSQLELREKRPTATVVFRTDADERMHGGKMVADVFRQVERTQRC
jgi:hypothetical protein